MIAATLLIAGFLFLLGGGEALVRGAVAIGKRLDLPPLLIGMVIVGFGTSAPELVVSVDATLKGSPGLAVGNVIGSNISNVLLILATAAIVRPIARPPTVLMPDGLVLLGITALILTLGLQGVITRPQGLILVTVLVVLIIIEYLRARRKAQLARILQEPMPLPAEMPQRLLVSVLLAVTGIAGLVYGADMLVQGAVRIADGLGVSKGLIGLTIVAVGTSLPELASSLVASRRGHSDVAYGNVIGSNLFNLLGVLGAAAIAGNLQYPDVMTWFDGPVMLAATVLMLVFVSTGKGLSRAEGAFLLAGYFIYILARYAYALS
jgi:cation:H+ antiporter